MRPSFFVVGAQKAGTTALHHYLSQHPQVRLPAVKETHFFSDGHHEYARGTDFYLGKYFAGLPGEGGAVAGEVDPEYLFYPDCAGRIADAFPAARIIAVLRDPVSRAYSHYWMNVRRGWETLSFEDAVEAEPRRMAEARTDVAESDLSKFSYLGRCYYHRQIQRYLAQFPAERLLILFSEDLHGAPERVLDAVHRFIGVEPRPIGALEKSQRNESAEARSRALRDLVTQPSLVKRAAGVLLPQFVKGAIWDAVDRWNRKPGKTATLDPGIEEELRERFREDVLALAELTSRDLSHWLTLRDPRQAKSAGAVAGQS